MILPWTDQEYRNWADMVVGICHNDFKILLARTFKFKNKIPIFRHSDIPMMWSLLWCHFSNSKLKFECIFIRRWHGHCFDVILISKFEFSLIRRWRGYFFDVILILKLKFSEMTFCYRTVPTTIGKSWVVLWFDIDNRKTAVRPCSPNHRGVGEYMMRAGNINSVFGHHSWLLEYPIFVA